MEKNSAHSVRAQRLTEIEAGLTQGEEREYLISHEGAATSSDIIVGLYTEWLAPDGTPLPAALGTNRGEDYGLTGRLAKVVDGNLVAVSAGQAVEDTTSLDEALTTGSTGNVAEFGIGPGRQLQLLRLPEFGQGNEHYYLNLFGRALNKEVCSHCQYDQSGAHPTLAGRPNHFAPLYVPRYDEATTLALRAEARKLAHEQDEAAKEIDPQYIWVVRPEYQFSQLDFKVDDILGSYEDENGEKQSRNLLENRAPIISRPDELIELFYEMTLPGQDSLPAFDGDRQYVIAIGETEFLLDPDAPEPIRLEQLAHLIQLANLTTAEDFLTIRLFLHHDPANLLWEEGGEEIDLLRLLGGARLHYRFNFPNGAQPQSMRMWINASGRICPSLATASDECTTVSAGAGPVTEVLLEEWGPEDASLSDTHPRWGLYWEPESWELGLDARLRVEVSYWAGDQLVQYSDEPVPGFEEQTHEPIVAYVRNRLLQPKDKPMKGTDVAMLETMLWQLGLSPQMRTDGNNHNSGRSGARIDSNRGGSLGWTHNCQDEKAESREQFYTGWGADCEAGQVSLEGMVKRYQARNTLNGRVSGNNHGLHSGRVIRAQDSDKIDGAAGEMTLSWLKRDWKNYMAAYARHPSEGDIGYGSEGINQWLNNAVEMWSHGFSLPTAEGQNRTIVPSTYTESLHLEMLVAAEIVDGTVTEVPEDFSRMNLMRSWKEQESPNHWGKGSPRTPYRVTEGSADEAASLSFNQVQYRYRYGFEPCQAHYDADLNYFDPEGNMRGFVIHLASSGAAEAGRSSCAGSFYLRFAENQPNYRTLPADLVGHRDNNTFHPANGGNRNVEDMYEILAHGIGGYQGGAGLGGLRSWPQMLRSSTYIPVAAVANSFDDNTQANGRCTSCTYAMEVLDRFFGSQHRRTYIWRGASYPEGHPQAGQPEWCFEYGEAEWRNPGFMVPSPANAELMIPAGFEDYRQMASIDESERTLCE